MYLEKPLDDTRNNCFQSTQHIGQSDWNVEVIKIQTHFRGKTCLMSGELNLFDTAKDDVQDKFHVGCDSNNHHQCSAGW